MTSASVTLHESNLSAHADALILSWMRVHHRKVMKRRKPDEWRITCVWAKGWPTARRRERGRPCPPSYANCLGWQTPASQTAPPSLPGPLSPEAADSLQKREIACSRWGHLLWLARPRIVSLSHVTYSCFLLWQHFKTGAFQFWVRHKREKGEEELTRPLFTPAQILWKSRHQEKNQIKRQQKPSNPSPTKSCRPPLQLPSPFSL